MHDQSEALLPQEPAAYSEDVTPTSSRELAGWYSYAWAAEVFVICGVGSFIPIVLEQLAREQGVLFSDHSTKCSEATGTETQCVVFLFGAAVNTASFAMYTFSISVFFQALIIVSMSGAADHGSHRKMLLLSFAIVGSLATMLFLPLTSAAFIFAAILAIVSNVCFGASSVLLNAFLPVLVRNHPNCRDDGERAETSTSTSAVPAVPSSAAIDVVTSPLPTTAVPHKRPPTADLEADLSARTAALALATRISSNGVSIGYAAAVIFQIAAIGLLILMGSTTFSMQLVLFAIGLWWLLFTIPSAMYLRARPGPPLENVSAWSSISYLKYSWSKLLHTIRSAFKLRDITLFLFAWFLLSDALSTTSSSAVLFAKTELQMKPAALALINVIATVFGVLGALFWSSFSRRIGLTPISTIAVCIAIFELIPLYGLTAYIPFVKRWGVLGLQQPWEIYILAAVYGLVLGGVSSYCRAVFGELIPSGSEAAFYALYAITDKGSSIFGPLIVGIIANQTGSIRPAFIFLSVLIIIPLPIILMVDLTRGREDARKAESATTDPEVDRHQD